MKIRYLLGLILITLCQLANAQEVADTEKDRQYVTDQLRLSLYQDPDAQSKVLELLRSGDLLLIDEIRGPYARVTTPDGLRGWVKRGFLISNPTANILLREEQQKTASLFEEIEKLGNSKVIIDTYEKDMDVMAAKIEELEATNREANETIARLEQEIQVEQQQETQDEIAVDNEQPQGNVVIPMQGELAAVFLWNTLKAYWTIIAPLLVVILLLSFLVSKIVIEARIKRRFHGIKIW